MVIRGLLLAVRRPVRHAKQNDFLGLGPLANYFSTEVKAFRLPPSEHDRKWAASSSVTKEHFDQALRSLGVDKDDPVVVAVSGGADSMALASLAKETLPKALAVTVDHGLRPESADEARLVKSLLENSGIEHITCKLEWDGGPQRSNVQMAARDLRYRELLRVCKETRAVGVLTAHHMDDQAETFVLRLAGGSGIDGLAGMSEKTTVVTSEGPLPVMRPLLRYSKDQLYQTCVSRGLQWVEDPTNIEPLYQRNAVRFALQDLYKDTADITADRLCSLAHFMSLSKRHVDLQVDEAVARHVNIDHWVGTVSIGNARAALGRLPRHIAVRMLGRVLKGVSGLPYPPDLPPILQLLQDISATVEGNSKAKAVHGCICECNGDAGSLFIYRQPPTRAERTRQHTVHVTGGQPIWWDGRFKLRIVDNNARVDGRSNTTYIVRACEDRDIRQWRKWQRERGLSQRRERDHNTKPDSVRRAP